MHDTYSPPPRGGEYFLVLIILFALGASMPFQAKPPLPTGLLFDDVYLQHLSGDTGHPERPERLTAIRDGLEKAGLLNTLPNRAAPGYRAGTGVGSQAFLH